MGIYVNKVMSGLSALNSSSGEINNFLGELSNYNEAIISTAYSANIGSLATRTNASILEINNKLQLAMQSLNNSGARNALIEQARAKDLAISRSKTLVKDAHTSKNSYIVGSTPKFNFDDRSNMVSKM